MKETLSSGNVTFGGNSTYGLSTNANSHMMKNSEWGAVAYLSHSKYGIGEEIYINNSSGYYTGRSGGNVGGSVNTVKVQYPDQTSTSQYNTYGYYTWLGQAVGTDGKIGAISDVTQGTKASTTGNVTGVYDMSGGAWEYVMGVLADASGNPRSGNSSSYNSGFNGALSSGSKTDGINFPESSFYDLYTTSTTTTACNGGPCFGHALHETYGWYSDNNSFVSSSSPWFLRGGYYSSGAHAGAFGFNFDSGGAYDNVSWRSVLFAS